MVIMIAMAFGFVLSEVYAEGSGKSSLDELVSSSGDAINAFLSAEGENEQFQGFPCSGAVANPANVRLTNCDADSATIAWDPVPNATGYLVYYYFNGKPGFYDVKNKTKLKLAVATVSNSYYTTCCLIAYAQYVDASGVSGVDYSCTGVNGDLGTVFTGIRRLTKKINKFGILSAYPSSKQFDIAASFNGDGFEIEGMAVNNKKNKFKGKGKGVVQKTIKVKKQNTVYKYRVRAYVKLANKTKKGKWSKWQYFMCMEKEAITGGLVNRTSNKKYKMSWPKLSGVSKVEISRSTSPTSGYTKVGTAKGSATSYVINKTFELYTDYYVKLSFYTKVGKKNKKVDERICTVRIIRM